MNVLSWSYCFPNAHQPTWGVFVEQRLAALNRKVDLQVVAPTPYFPLLTRLHGRSLPHRENWHGLTVHRPRFFYIPAICKSLDGWFYGRGLTAWLKQFRQQWRPDVLDAHFVWPDGVGVAYLARKLKLPYIITLRGKIYPCLEIPSQRRQCAQALIGAAAVISVSSPMADEARKLGVPDERLFVIPNGVDLRHFAPRNKMDARRQLGLPLDKPLIVAVAHLKAAKGHGELIRALQQLDNDVHLVIVGGEVVSGYRRELERLSLTLGVLQRVILADRQAYDKIPLYLNAADVSVLASYREGCPNVVLESLACGTPVVATRVGAVEDLMAVPRDGQIVPPRDAEALAAAIKQVFSATKRADYHVAAGAVKSWDAVAEQVQMVFNNTLQRPITC
ncbi:MAG: glycosyltransferase [Sedimentisphaerales bacterium]|nr:glycosyltransferase [Sedimentisphaerales bacterium]